jgi:hypothetical protein
VWHNICALARNRVHPPAGKRGTFPTPPPCLNQLHACALRGSGLGARLLPLRGAAGMQEKNEARHDVLGVLSVLATDHVLCQSVLESLAQAAKQAVPRTAASTASE